MTPFATTGRIAACLLVAMVLHLGEGQKEGARPDRDVLPDIAVPMTVPDLRSGRYRPLETALILSHTMTP